MEAVAATDPLGFEVDNVGLFAWKGGDLSVEIVPSWDKAKMTFHMFCIGGGSAFL